MKEVWEYANENSIKLDKTMKEDKKQNLFDLIIWVDASERIGLPESTNKISQKEAHIILTNNSTFDEFEQKSILIGKMILEMDKNPFKTNQMIW